MDSVIVKIETNEVKVTAQEAKGTAATIGVDGTTTLDAGEEAYVENIGTANSANLHFYIPKGEVGSGIASIIPGSNIDVDSTDPQNPIVSATIITEHAALTGRSEADSHSIEAITGLSSALSEKASTQDVQDAITTAEDFATAADSAVLSSANAYTDSKIMGYWSPKTTIDLSDTVAPLFFTGLSVGKRYRLRLEDVHVHADGSNAIYYRVRTGGSAGTIVPVMYAGYNVSSLVAAVTVFRSTSSNSFGFLGGFTFTSAYLPADANEVMIGVGSNFESCHICVRHEGYRYDATPAASSVLHNAHVVPISAIFDTLEIYCAQTATFISGKIILDEWIENG